MSAHLPEAVLMCGIAGSGKTTYAQRLERRGYVRLSIDEMVWRTFGRYDVDYPASEYAPNSEHAEMLIHQELEALLRSGCNVVVDNAFWKRETRDEYKRLIEAAGGRWRLVYLNADDDVLRRRLAARRDRFDANAAFPITDEILNAFLADFEEPNGEGEEVLDARLDDAEERLLATWARRAGRGGSA